jgi:hypothetical protein
MSEWTHIEGKHNSKRVSIRKLVDLVWGGEDIVFDKQENGEEFSFRAETGGMNAAKHIDIICREFKKLDKSARLNITATIEFGV